MPFDGRPPERHERPPSAGQSFIALAVIAAVVVVVCAAVAWKVTR
jgi:hypothetical protein